IEELILDDPATRGAAELVSFQRIARSRRFLPGVEVAVAQKLEQISVERVSARFGHNIDDSPWMEAVLSRKSIRLDIELLNKIRHRNRQVDIAEGVVVITAIQQVTQPICLAACDRKCLRGVRALHVLVTC